jgi:hypothetical protein
MSNAIDLEHLNETSSEHLCFDRPMGNHNGRLFLDWVRHLRTPLPHCRSHVYGELQMIDMAKRLLATPSPLEMAARELVQAQRAKLEAESAREYAYHMVRYNDDRINRLRERLDELKGEQA